MKLNELLEIIPENMMILVESTYGNRIYCGLRYEYSGIDYTVHFILYEDRKALFHGRLGLRIIVFA